MDTFVEATETFIEASKGWLTDEDAPAVASLRIMAKQLDKRFAAATAAQYNLAYRHLRKQAPDGAAAVDPLEALLDD